MDLNRQRSASPYHQKNSGPTFLQQNRDSEFRFQDCRVNSYSNLNKATLLNIGYNRPRCLSTISTARFGIARTHPRQVPGKPLRYDQRRREPRRETEPVAGTACLAARNSLISHLERCGRIFNYVVPIGSCLPHNFHMHSSLPIGELVKGRL